MKKYYLILTIGGFLMGVIITKLLLISSMENKTYYQEYIDENDRVYFDANEKFYYWGDDYIIPKKEFIKYHRFALALAYTYLNHLYFSEYYGTKIVELLDLRGDLEEEYWIIYHKNKKIMKINQNNGSIVMLTDIKDSQKPLRQAVNIEVEGVIPSETMAMAIAEVIWLEIYGRNVLNKKPYKFRYEYDKNTKIWYIRGDIDDLTVAGGVPYIKLRASDGAILGIFHDQ